MVSNLAMHTLTFVVLLAACSNGRRSKQEGAPGPDQVLAECTRGLDTAKHFSSVIERDEPGLVTWSLFFDDIPIAAIVGSARSRDHWKPQCYRSLHGPEPLRRGDLISERRAVEQAGVTAPAHVRLEYYAFQKDIPNFPGATNEMDFEMVIDHYEPMFEVKDERGEGALVNAYTGGVFMKLTNWRS